MLRTDLIVTQSVRTLGTYPRLALLTAAGIGIALQGLQHEDPTPMYRYFTIWSAAVLCLYGSGLLARFRVVDSYVRTAGSAGAVFSALVYLLVIAPVNGFGHEGLTIAANVVLHVMVPIAVLGLYTRHRQWSSPPRMIAASLAFPAGYLAWALLVSTILGTAPVYLFLDADRVGALSVLGVAVGGAMVYSFIAWLLSHIAGHRA